LFKNILFANIVIKPVKKEMKTGEK